MKTWIAAAALVAAVVGMHSEAVAQKATVYRYCLQEGGGSIFGGGGFTLCRYETLAQCWASKNSPNDFCYLNPAYPGRK
jgi:hypothetical protein